MSTAFDKFNWDAPTSDMEPLSGVASGMSDMPVATYTGASSPAEAAEVTVEATVTIMAPEGMDIELESAMLLLTINGVRSLVSVALERE